MASTNDRLGSYRRMYTIGDGSCFFHAVSAAVNLSNYNACSTSKKTVVAHKLRACVCDQYSKFLQDLSVDLRESVDKSGRRIFDTVADAANTTRYAGEALWRLTATLLKVNILVHQSPTTTYVSPDRRGDLYPTTIVIAHVNGNHFEPFMSRNRGGIHATDSILIQKLLPFRDGV